MSVDTPYDILLFSDKNRGKNAASTTFHNAVEPVLPNHDRHIARSFNNSEKLILLKASSTLLNIEVKYTKLLTYNNELHLS